MPGTDPQARAAAATSPTQSLGTQIILGFQHLIAMFGATVFVPILTGLSIPVALFTAGAGTLLFHALTGGRVPVFLGSSFAFIPAMLAVKELYGLEYALGGVAVAGLVYGLAALAIRLWGSERISRFLPDYVIGPIIITIGWSLVPVAWGMAASHWLVALTTLGAVLAVMVLGRGFFRVVPVLGGIVVGYIAAAFFGLLDFGGLASAPLLQAPAFMFPAFSAAAILMVAPIALVTMIEHIGDITTNGSVVGKDFVKQPGLHRTLLGDGLATTVAGLLGGPANTTYSENTGVLALTRVYNPAILRIAAVMAIALAFSGKFGALIASIPASVMGGVSLVLFNMIAYIGFRRLKAHSGWTVREVVIAAVTLGIGLAPLVPGNPVRIGIAAGVELAGLSLAALVGIVLSAVWPKKVAG